MIIAIIFDCFGVIINDALESFLNQREMTPEVREEVIGLINAANRGQISTEDFRKNLANKLDMEFDDYMQIISRKETKNIELLEYIKTLKSKYKLAMLSNVSSVQSLNSRFNEGELTDLFDVVVPSGQIGFAKPEAQAYEITAEKLGVSLSECLMIDDREEYCLGAIGVGMKAIQYKNNQDLKTELAKIL